MSPYSGSSASTQVQAGDAQRWHPHPVAAGLLRALIRIGPLVLAFFVATFVGGRIERGDTVAAFGVWLGCVVVVSIATVVVADRLLERLLPLVALLKLSLAFPDENVPSRLRFALRSGTAKQLERRLDAGEVRDDESEAVRTLLTLLTVLRDHDRLTRGHSERVRAFSYLIGEKMELSEHERDLLNWAALAHDVGKLAVEPEILAKKGKPTRMEWEKLREHPAAAEPLLAPIRDWLGDWADAATQHHERWDGGGYPYGLAGEEISLAGRIVAVADAFDVMTAARSYKPALPVDDALAELTRNAGTQFDPVVVRAFLAVPPRRLRLVMGAFGWVGNLPLLGEVSAITTAGGPAASAAASVVAAGAVVVTSITPTLDFLSPVEQESPWATESNDAAREVDSTLPEESSPSSVTVTVTLPGPSTSDDPLPSTTTPLTGETTTTAPGDEPSPSSSSSTAPPSSTSSTTAPPSSSMIANDDTFTITKTEFTSLPVQNNDVPGSEELDSSATTIVEPPTRGTATVQGLTIRYTPNAGETSGPDGLVYRSCDNAGACDTATVTLTLAVK